jgi:hypothetical protein
VPAKIAVVRLRPGAFRVEVSEGGARTDHTVTVDDAYARSLGGDGVDGVALVRRSFEFLLEREPKESILKTFALPVIGRYFPEYEVEMRRRLVS